MQPLAKDLDLPRISWVSGLVWATPTRVIVLENGVEPTVEIVWDVSPVGLHLIDTRAWSVRKLATEATSAVSARDLVLAFSGTWPEGSKGAGLRAYGPDGDERFHLFGDSGVGWVEIAWPYAYVHNGREGKQFDVVDLRSGRVVATPRSSRQITIVGY